MIDDPEGPGEHDAHLLDDDDDGDEDESPCPACGRMVWAQAQQCPHCGEWFAGEAWERQAAGGKPRPTLWWWVAAVLVVVLLWRLITFGRIF